MSYTQGTYYKALSKKAVLSTNLVIPWTKTGQEYSVNGNPEQSKIIHMVVDTIIKFLLNDQSYWPLYAIIMGCVVTGKFYVISKIISIIRQLTSCNNTVQVLVPSGAVAYNVQGSTIHRLWHVSIRKPEKCLSIKMKERLSKRLEQLLVLVIDERSQVNSKVLAKTERNARECIYNGQNSTE